MKFFLRSLLPGLFLILLGFAAGTIPNPIFSMFGFLAFFVVGISVIVEGWRKRRS